MTHPAPSSAPVSPSVAETMRRFQIDETLARPVAAGRLVDAVPFVLDPDQPPEWAAVTLDVEGIELVLAAGLCDLSRCWETDLRHRHPIDGDPATLHEVADAWGVPRSEARMLSLYLLAAHRKEIDARIRAACARTWGHAWWYYDE